MYNELKLEYIIQTIRTLQQRIAERFPGSGLSKVAAELLRIAEETGPILTQKKKPHRLVQAAVVLAVVLLIAIPLGLLITARGARFEVMGWGGIFQVVESIIQDAIFLGFGVYFLITVESRLDRRVSIRELQ